VKKIAKRYPRPAKCKDGDIQLELFAAGHRSGMLSFAQSLPEHDLLFLKRNITEQKVLDAWLESEKSGDMLTVVAVRDERILGCTAIISDKLSWSAHVGEIRVLVAEEMRDQGLGRILIQECFILGLHLGLDKLLAQMTSDQEAAMAVFEDMGFRTEALFKDHVKDHQGEKHDIIMLSHDVEQLHAHKDVYGLTDAF